MPKDMARHWNMRGTDYKKNLFTVKQFLPVWIRILFHSKFKLSRPKYCLVSCWISSVSWSHWSCLKGKFHCCYKSLSGQYAVGRYSVASSLAENSLLEAVFPHHYEGMMLQYSSLFLFFFSHYFLHFLLVCNNIRPAPSTFHCVSFTNCLIQMQSFYLILFSLCTCSTIIISKTSWGSTLNIDFVTSLVLFCLSDFPYSSLFTTVKFSAALK